MLLNQIHTLIQMLLNTATRTDLIIMSVPQLTPPKIVVYFLSGYLYIRWCCKHHINLSDCDSLLTHFRLPGKPGTMLLEQLLVVFIECSLGGSMFILTTFYAVGFSLSFQSATFLLHTDCRVRIQCKYCLCHLCFDAHSFY